jgi:cytochrome c-type biogenesis protein CcmF
MIAELGYGTLLIAFLLVVYGILSMLVCALRHEEKWINSARVALQLMFPLLTLTVLFLLILLALGTYEVSYVYQVSSDSMPLYLKFAALWGGQSGSLLFWSWVLSIFAFIVMRKDWIYDKDLLPWVIFIIMVVLSFFIGLSLFQENPFVRYWQLSGGTQVESMFRPTGALLLSPSDGRGMNPLLRHPGMILHPPLLYMGFTAFIIPYAFAIAALIKGRQDMHWLRSTRSWSILAWLFLSAGLILGSRWAYDVLGWGGYWSWDPVENAALMPWLLATAYIHSAMLQEKRGLFKRWNIILILLMFAMVIYGTFLTRSGVLSSVHAFSESSIGLAYLVFIAVMFTGSLILLFLRWGKLSSESWKYSVYSREAIILLINLLLFGLFFIVFLGVNFPIFSELITSQKITVGPRWYEQTTGPLFAGILLLMTIGPLTAWGNSTVKTILHGIRIPFILSIGIGVGFYLSGIKNWAALLGCWLIVLSILTTLTDLIHGILKRNKAISGPRLKTIPDLMRRYRRKYGAYFVHISIALMALGIIGIEFYQTETQITLSIADKVEFGPYTLQLAAIDEFDFNDERYVTRAVLHVMNGQQLVIAELHPRRDYYYDTQQAVTIPGIHSTLKDDLYVVLVDWEPINSSQATFKIYRNRMVNWLWIGGVLLLLSGMMVIWPDTRKNRQPILERL